MNIFCTTKINIPDHISDYHQPAINTHIGRQKLQEVFISVECSQIAEQTNASGQRLNVVSADVQLR